MNDWIFLSGMMGSGKTTVARRLARRLELEAVDLDELIAAEAGMSIRALFSSAGEAGFRALERQKAQLLLGGAPRIVSLGGGTVTDEGLRRQLLATGTVITLRATPAELARRLSSTDDRPLLSEGEAEKVIAQLMRERAEAYAECHAAIDTEGRTPGEVADLVVEFAERRMLAVPLGGRSYNVEVGRGLGRTRLRQLVDRHLNPARTLVVSDTHVEAAWGADLRRSSLSSPDLSWLVLPPGEEHKNLETMERIWTRALDIPLDRKGTLLAVGGGVVGDLTGFAAATLYRGVPFASVPTTLLAMVDASVGGKTGFDRPQGKNLVGAFHQPRFVLCDLDFLRTLPDREYRAGLAEVVKAAWLESESAVATLERNAAAISARDADTLEPVVRSAIATKIRIVAADEWEAGHRRVLNLGHTIGHAIEAATGYGELLHGEAVSLGLVAALRVAEFRHPHRGGTERLIALLRAFELPVDLDAYLNDATFVHLEHDKKREGSIIHFIVPGHPGEVSIEAISVTELRRIVTQGSR